MANKVAVAYEEAGQTYGEVGTRATTSYSIDSTGTATYGVKDLLYSMTSCTSALAEKQRDRLLAALGNPVASMSLDGGDVRATLSCVGWWELLAWQHYSRAIVFEGMYDGGTPNAATHWPSRNHGIGSVAGNKYVAQTFQLAGAGFYADWVDVQTIWPTNSSGVAYNPSKAVTVSICQDAGGTAPGTVICGGTIAAGAITNYGWAKATLAPKVLLAPSTDYWLLLTRSDGNISADTPQVGLTQFSGRTAYARGSFWQSGALGSGWGEIESGDCDMLFSVNGALQTTDQISAIVTANANGMILGTVVTDASGIYTPPYRAGDTEGLREIEQLLDAGTSDGTRLLARVRSDRYVEVYKEPTASTTNDIYVRPDGKLVTWRGQLVDKPSLLPGQWCRLVLDDRAESELGLLGNVSPCFIDEVEYVAATDEIRIRTREKSEPWDIGKVVML
jgi:hypothetical protein